MDRCLGGPLPRRLANPTHPHPASSFMDQPCGKSTYRALILISKGCARARGRLDTRCSPIRRSPPWDASIPSAAPRLACVRPVASVHPEPGSNSSLYNQLCVFARKGVSVRPGSPAQLSLLIIYDCHAFRRTRHKRAAACPSVRSLSKNSAVREGKAIRSRKRVQR